MTYSPAEVVSHSFIQTNPRKAENFDKMFTKVPLNLTPVESNVMLMNARGDEFQGFSFVNPYFGSFYEC